MNFDLLVSNLYAAANGRGDWTAALGDIASAMGLWTVQVLGMDKRTGHLTFSVHGGNSTPQTALDYFRHYSATDPRVGLALNGPKGEWFHCHEHFDENFVRNNDFYQSFLIPHGGRYASAFVLNEADDIIFLLALMRGSGSQPLMANDLALMNQFKHHFSEALRNMVHVREAFAELGMARVLLAQFAYPMVMVDETRGIWHRNEAATNLLQHGDVVREQGGLLTCLDKSSDAALTEAIYSLKLEGNAPPRRHAVPLTSANGARHLVFVSSIQASTTLGAFGHQARALLIFHDPANLRPAPDAMLLAECFDLTPAEARVAALIASGVSAKAIAQQNGVTLPTVRTHIQRVMAKSSVVRQADLARVLNELPL